jgi:hypothetical protein
VSAAARGAAGYLRMRRDGMLREIRAKDSDVERFVQTLIRRGVSETRARELAAEQQAKNFQRPRSGARR